MLALLATITFALWFVLDLLAVSLDPINLAALGATFLAAHFVPAAPWRRG